MIISSFYFENVKRQYHMVKSNCNQKNMVKSNLKINKKSIHLKKLGKTWKLVVETIEKTINFLRNMFVSLGEKSGSYQLDVGDYPYFFYMSFLKLPKLYVEKYRAATTEIFVGGVLGSKTINWVK